MVSRIFLSFLFLCWLQASAQSISNEINVEPGDLHVQVKEVVAGSKDTLWLVLDGGSNLGIKAGLKGYGVQVYNNKKSRDYKTLTRLTVTTVGASISKAWLLVPKGELAASYILPDDQAYFIKLVSPPARAASKIFRELALLNIRFVNLNDSFFYSQPQMINEATLHADRRLIRDLLADVHSTGKWLNELKEKDAAWLKPQTGGRFKGMALLDAMKNASTVDMEAFLHFVLEFPGKYLGHKWRINETFATWIINNTPMPAAQDYLVDALEEVPADLLPAWVNVNRFYTDTIIKLVSKKINKYLDNSQWENAKSLVDKSYILAKTVADKKFESLILNSDARLAQLQKKNDEAIVLYSKAISLDTSNANAYWYRGNIYAEQDRYEAAINDLKVVNRLFPNYSSAWGNAGWYYLKQFKVADAGPFVKRAFELDSSTSAWSVNLGHYYLLTNKPEQARRLYQKTLDNLSSEAEFYQGPMADFELFSKSGLFQDLLTREKDWMLDQFHQTYQHYVRADSLFNLAKEWKNKNEYAKAIQYYTASREAELKAKKQRPLYIHNITTWIGYMQAQSKDYQSGEKNYLEALALAQSTLKPKNVQGDLALLGDLYESWGKKALSDGYRAEARALEYQLEDEATDKNLYIVSIGVNSYKDVAYQWAAADAQNIADALQKKGKGFDNVYTYVLTNEKAISDSLDRTMQRIVGRAKRGDTFIFYFTGKAITNQFESYLIPYNFTDYENDSLLRNKAISARLLRSWSNSIEAKRQFFLLDAAASYFTSTFASQVSQLSLSKVAAQRDLTIMSATFPRIEKSEFKSSVVANSFLNLLSDANATMDKSITCRRVENFFADKVSRNNYFLSLETYSQGRDFVLANYDVAPAKKQTDEMSPVKRGSIEDVVAGNEGANNENRIGKRYALLIATDIYKDPKWIRLNNPIRDASAMKKELENNFGFEVDTLYNPNYSRISHKLDAYSKKKFNKNDQLIILFSGHGYYDARRNEGYLIPSDAQYTDLEFDRQYFSFSSIVSNLKAIKAQHMLVLMDACHGGALVDKAIMRDVGDDLYRNLEKEERIKNHLQHPNRLIITSGRKDQKVYDGSDGKNSPFITAILNAMGSDEVKRTGLLSYYSIMKYITEMQKTEAAQGKFDPADNNEFVLEYQPNRLKKEADVVLAKQ